MYVAKHYRVVFDQQILEADVWKPYQPWQMCDPEWPMPKGEDPNDWFHTHADVESFGLYAIETCYTCGSKLYVDYENHS